MLVWVLVVGLGVVVVGAAGKAQVSATHVHVRARGVAGEHAQGVNDGADLLHAHAGVEELRIDVVGVGVQEVNDVVLRGGLVVHQVLAVRVGQLVEAGGSLAVAGFAGELALLAQELKKGLVAALAVGVR